MAAGDLAQYLSAATADYTATQLDVKPQKVMIEQGRFNQKRKRLDDGTPVVVTKSATPIFIMKLQWPVLSEANANTIIDFYCDTSKAYGSRRSFEFPHPTDGNTYIVRFWSEISRSVSYLRAISEIKLLVVGYKS
jgi:hypothetical protein